ncbi:MAG: TlpA family protein disulfide reductase, partial [Chloroflexi bacterium]|nr:TlpA family protein disulfide reductase [Chloroflexota bacterium]
MARRKRSSSRSGPISGRGWLQRHRGLVIGAIVGAVVVGLAVASIARQVTASENFAFTTYEGHAVPGLDRPTANFEDLLALGKPVVLNFWGGSCPPCRAEMPDIEAVHQKFGDQAVFFGLDVGPFVGLGTRHTAESLMRELGTTYAAAYPKDGSPVRVFNITGLPQTIFFDAQGNIIRRWPGVLTMSQLERILRSDLG